MTRLASVTLLACLILHPAAAHAQKGKPAPPAEVAADTVFSDSPGDLLGSDLLNSDGASPHPCSRLVDPSRYCGGNHPTYAGLGPECSRISFTSAGDYVFRTRSSRCDPSAGPLRSALVDLTDFISGPCTGDAAAKIERTIFDPETAQYVVRALSLCGTTLVEDVRIDAPGMRTQSSTRVVVLLSLHGPPLANTTQFTLEYTTAVPVTGDSQVRALSAGATTHVARLYELVPGKGGKLVKVWVGDYRAPLALSAAVVP